MKNQLGSFFQKNAALLNQWVIYLGIFITLAGLALMAYLGLYNRYWSDDWCYNVDFKNLGIGGALNTYFLPGDDPLRGFGYSTNRYSLTLLAGLLYLTGISGAKITATLVIVSWLVGLLVLLSNLSKISGVRSNKTLLILGATILLYYTLYISPQRFQILYWIAGIHYSFSIITGIYLTGIITYQITREKRSKIADYLTVPLAFLAGGLSETGCTYLLSGAVLAFFATWYGRRKQAAWAVKAFPTVLIALLSLLSSFIVLVLSPSNTTRIENISANQNPLPQMILLSFKFSLDFMVDSIRSIPIPHIVYGIAILSVSILAGAQARDQRPRLLWKTVLSILAVMVVVWLLISAVQAPTVYFYSAPSDPRGKSLARFTMLAGLAVIAWLIGQTINFRWQNKLLIVLALLGITLNVVYTARSITQIYTELPGFVYRARLWDQRDADIKSAREQGVTRLKVIVIDMKGAGVRDIMRSNSMDREWVSSCASRYYGLEAIKAISP